MEPGFPSIGERWSDIAHGFIDPEANSDAVTAGHGDFHCRAEDICGVGSEVFACDEWSKAILRIGWTIAANRQQACRERSRGNEPTAARQVHDVLRL